MVTKRVILANGSRLLREMLRRVISKTDHLQVVQEILDHEELSSAIEQFDPEWVIVFMPAHNTAHGWIETCMAQYPAVRFILFSPDDSSITMRSQAPYEEDLTNLSLKNFIYILEKDLQHI